MTHKARAFVGVVASALISPVFAAGPVTVGEAAPAATNYDQPRYGATTIANERVGVKSGNTKTILFAVHERTADSSGRFVVHFPYVPNEPSYARVTAAAYTRTGTALTGVNCVTATATVNGTCTFPVGTRVATVTFAPVGTAAYSYRTYSTTYFQDCDNSAARYCGTERLYNTYSATFTSDTENRAGTIYQGDVDIFNSNVSVNTPRAGDLVSVRVFSDKAIVNNIPTLRVKADFGTGETQIGHRYPCTPTPGGVAGKDWECKIPEGDGVPNLAGYANPRIVFSSSRGEPGATITITNAVKNTSSLVCN